MPEQILKFPNKFFWGTATSAFQIEGHPEESLAKLSDWSEWIEREDKVRRPTNEGRAVDHYQHLHEDIQLIKNLNNNAYRFSFNWARLHRGPGEFDDNTVKFYETLLDQLAQRTDLKARRIEPFATITHFTIPSWLYQQGGWENPQTAYEFANFTRFLVNKFGQKIKYWMTHNEPNIFLGFGYESGIWPPGYENDYNRYFKAYQGMVLGHQLAYKEIKTACPNSQVGFAQNLYAFEAYDEILQKMQTNYPGEKWNSLDLLPNLMRKQLHNFAFLESALELDALDFLGVNYYTRFSYKLSFNAKDPANSNLDSLLWGELQDLNKVNNRLYANSLGWEIYPQGLYSVLTDKKFLRLMDSKPIYITENGYCHVDNQPGSYASQEAFASSNLDYSKDLDDKYRIKFINEHLIAVHRAISDGANVCGYFYWSLLDNFEWSLGMSPRFGLVHVDHDSFIRTPKASYNYYAEISKNNGLQVKNPKDSYDSQSCSSQTSLMMDSQEI